MNGRMPFSVTASLAFHAAAFGLLIFTGQMAAQHKLTVINNVDFIQVKKAVAIDAKPAPRPAANTFDFLKMALPAVQHAAAPKLADVKLPDVHKPMQVEAPKLKDRGRLDAGPKLDMDLDKGKNLDIAKVDARIPSRKIAALAAMPRLEEVGRRRVANLPQAIAMEERRQEAIGLKGMNALAGATERRSAAAAQPQGLSEAAAPSNFSQKIASLLPDQRIEMKQAVMPTPAIKQGIESPVVRERRKPANLEDAGQKKGVEIEGPLADRKVTAYEIPEFPSWAKQQGVLEASVAIRFWVNAAGDVLPNMRVEHTSGYGKLDRLAMDSLSKWKFAPLATGERQWGVITFRFLLE